MIKFEIIWSIDESQDTAIEILAASSETNARLNQDIEERASRSDLWVSATPQDEYIKC